MTALPEGAFGQFQYPTVPLHVLREIDRDPTAIFWG